MAIRERKFEVIEFPVQNVKDHNQIDCHLRSRLARRTSSFSWEQINLEMTHSPLKIFYNFWKIALILCWNSTLTETSKINLVLKLRANGIAIM